MTSLSAQVLRAKESVVEADRGEWLAGHEMTPEPIRQPVSSSAHTSAVSEYVAFVQRLLEVYPNARVILTDGAIVNDGADVRRAPKTTLRRYLTNTVVKARSTRVSTFFASHQPGDDCDPHPTAEQHEAMARELGEHLRQVLGW